MPTYAKHLIECNCILPQFLDRYPPVFHKFVVFSVIGDDGVVKPSVASCNNCRGLHNITEVGVSQKLKKESTALLETIDEIKSQLPDKLVETLAPYSPDLVTWQEVRFMYDNDQWGQMIILEKETDGDDVHVKALVLYGKTLWKLTTMSSRDL